MLSCRYLYLQDKGILYCDNISFKKPTWPLHLWCSCKVGKTAWTDSLRGYCLENFFHCFLQSICNFSSYISYMGLSCGLHNNNAQFTATVKANIYPPHIFSFLHWTANHQWGLQAISYIVGVCDPFVNVLKGWKQW